MASASSSRQCTDGGAPPATDPDTADTAASVPAAAAACVDPDSDAAGSGCGGSQLSASDTAAGATGSSGSGPGSDGGHSLAEAQAEMQEDGPVTCPPLLGVEEAAARSAAVAGCSGGGAAAPFVPPSGKVGPQDFEMLRVVGQGAFGKVFQVGDGQNGAPTLQANKHAVNPHQRLHLKPPLSSRTAYRCPKPQLFFSARTCICTGVEVMHPTPSPSHR